MRPQQSNILLILAKLQPRLLTCTAINVMPQHAGAAAGGSRLVQGCWRRSGHWLLQLAHRCLGCRSHHICMRHTSESSVQDHAGLKPLCDESALPAAHDMVT